MFKTTSTSFTFALTGRIGNENSLPEMIPESMKRLFLRGLNHSKICGSYFLHLSLITIVR